jgi:hypothetical protein
MAKGGWLWVVFWLGCGGVNGFHVRGIGRRRCSSVQIPMAPDVIGDLHAQYIRDVAKFDSPMPAVRFKECVRCLSTYLYVRLVVRMHIHAYECLYVFTHV